MPNQILTQKRLKELLSYNPSTGLFTWLVTSSNAAVAGSVAGSYCHGYILIGIDKSNSDYRAHRLAWLYMTGNWPKGKLDHINHVRDDNRWANIREVTDLENTRNLSLSINNKSGVTGVSWINGRNTWYAAISVNNKTVSLGKHKAFGDAVSARKAAELKYGFHPNHGK